ncbi:DUF1642 domain-containing protein [Enterococcus faecalis]|uniref:DUF1642 domain-containing protein n=1 Tax=Enterococcus faecalis TaxID=1351 RepID=UPI003DA0EF0E
MNKQELIVYLKCLEVPADFYLRSPDQNHLVEKAISLAKRLDEPKKAILPKTAYNFIEESSRTSFPNVYVISSADSFLRTMPDGEFSLRFRLNAYLFDGVSDIRHEVEKEPLYHVLLLSMGTINTGCFYMHLTEKKRFITCKEKAAALTENQFKAIGWCYYGYVVRLEG